jgi:diacylglycerol kinase family enzyme
MLRAGWGYVCGNLFGIEGMHILEGTSILIDVRGKRSIPVMIDGEFLSLRLPAKLELLPGALRVLKPKPPAS